MNAILDRQSQIARVLRKGFGETVIVSRNKTADLCYYEVEFPAVEGNDLNSFALAYSSVLRFQFVDFKTKRVMFLLFDDQANDLLQNNLNLLDDVNANNN